MAVLHCLTKCRLFPIDEVIVQISMNNIILQLFFLLHDHCKKFCISYTVVVAGQAQVWCLELLLCLDVGYRCSTLRCLSILLVDIAS